MALKIRTGNTSQTNSSVVINNPLLLRLLFLFRQAGGGREGVVYLGAHKERRNPFICIFPDFIREHLPSRDGSNVLPSTRPLIPCVNHFFRLHNTVCLGQKKKTKNKKTVLPLPLVVSDACFHFQIWNSCGADSYLGQHRASILAESESSSVLPKLCAKYLNKTTV